MQNVLLILLGLIIVGGCASSIVDGEYLRTSDVIYSPKPNDAQIDIFMSGIFVDAAVKPIGVVSARAYVLETGIEELKIQARKVGADAVTDIKYERKLSVNYLEDLYFIDGKAVVYEAAGGN